MTPDAQNKSPPRSSLPWIAKGQSLLIEPTAETQHTIAYFESREDAAYAARAANSLPALLKAAQQALTVLEPAPGGAARPVAEALRSAIKGAEP
jgi:hypothetical protein